MQLWFTTSGIGTTRTSRDVRLESVVRAIADIGSVFRADQNWAAWPRFAPRMSKRRPHSTHRQDARIDSIARHGD